MRYIRFYYSLDYDTLLAGHSAMANFDVYMEMSRCFIFNVNNLVVV